MSKLLCTTEGTCRLRCQDAKSVRSLGEFFKPKHELKKTKILRIPNKFLWACLLHADVYVRSVCPGGTLLPCWGFRKACLEMSVHILKSRGGSLTAKMTREGTPKKRRFIYARETGCRCCTAPAAERFRFLHTASALLSGSGRPITPGSTLDLKSAA